MENVGRIKKEQESKNEKLSKYFLYFILNFRTRKCCAYFSVLPPHFCSHSAKSFSRNVPANMFVPWPAFLKPLNSASGIFAAKDFPEPKEYESSSLATISASAFMFSAFFSG